MRSQLVSRRSFLRAAGAAGAAASAAREYVTDYVVAEVWLPGADGFLVHTLKGAHKTEILKGQKAH